MWGLQAWLGLHAPSPSLYLQLPTPDCVQVTYNISLHKLIVLVVSGAAGYAEQGLSFSLWPEEAPTVSTVWVAAKSRS